MPENVVDALEARIVVLETKIAYQDDAVETLNATVTAQWSAIEKLTRHLVELRDRLSHAETQAPSTRTDEIPPHY